MANLNLNKKPLPPAPGWGVPRRSWFWPALYLTLIPLAIIFALIYSFDGAVSASIFGVLAGAGWVLVWFVAVLVALDPIGRPRRRPPIRLPREAERKKTRTRRAR
ncbi:hypothetical protein [Microbacterium atlanticum]|uniref:hypothetical protein n=1 Tax=Microbacterium atlanticum TaxID=2782168 RepID=UPI001888F738|nr:hypothetical protein [Microbacterium atlanticum]